MSLNGRQLHISRANSIATASSPHATQALTKARYSPDLVFTDPVTYLEGYASFKLLMDSMRFLFKVGFDAHSAEITGPEEITTKCGSDQRK
jgi:hypothetical protein